MHFDLARSSHCVSCVCGVAHRTSAAAPPTCARTLKARARARTRAHISLSVRQLISPAALRHCPPSQPPEAAPPCPTPLASWLAVHLPALFLEQRPVLPLELLQVVIVLPKGKVRGWLTVASAMRRVPFGLEWF